MLAGGEANMMARPHSVHLGERIIAAVADGKSSTRACGQRAELMTAHFVWLPSADADFRTLRHD